MADLKSFINTSSDRIKSAMGVPVDRIKTIQGSKLNLTPEYRAIYNAVSVKPSQQIALAQNAFVKTLVDGGVWAKLSCIIPYCAGMPQAEDALFWWNNPTRKATLTETAPTYTAKEGFTGNGTSSYIDTTFNPSTDGGTLYTQNDCSAGFLFTNGRSTGNSGGSGISSGTNGVCIYPKYNLTVGTIRIQSNYYNFYDTGAIAKLFTLVRKSSSLINFYRDRTVFGADLSYTSAALLNMTVHNLHVNGDAASFQTDTIGLFYAGSQLIQSDINVMCDAIDRLIFDINSSEVDYEDNFSGTTIDTEKWTVINPNPTLIEFSQNDGLIMNEIAAVNANLYDNIVKSVLTKNYGMWEFDIMNIRGEATQSFSSFGLFNSATNKIELYRDYSGTDYFLFKITANGTPYIVSTGIADIAKFRIVITPTNNISLYAYINDAWVQVGVTQSSYIVSELKMFLGSTGYNKSITILRNLKISKHD